MHLATRVTRAGHTVPADGEPFAPGPVFASVFRAAGDPADSPFVYGRYHNPTWSDWERALEELEGGPAVAFSSGMAAVTAILATALAPGDTLVMPADGYYAARRLAAGWFGERGVNVRTAPTRGGAQLEQIEGARLLWLESPTNPGLDVCDIREVCAEARRRGVLVVVDNTTPTVLGQTPLELGADYSLASDTKSLTGHSDIVLGHVAVRDAAHADALRAWRTQTGAVPGPMEVWLAHRSLSTVEMRLTRSCANALAIARFLKGRNDVRGVRYPGLADDPSHGVAAAQMHCFGCVVSFVLRDRDTADRFLDACRIILPATSFGGIHTTAERRARWAGDDVSEGFIRLSAGCEHADDLTTDVAQALDAAR
ncbi:MAG: cystathionine gamma-lyase [Gemmatimonadetes bacterium]|nr:cystathionine gamma-lyase [Gemmatimonadota bacterium]